MQTLFNDAEVFQKERPTELTEKQKADFYIEQAKDLKAQGVSTDDEKDIIEDLKKLYPFRDNGFEMAKELDGYGCQANYNIDTNFCEWLDCLYSNYNEIETQNIKDWVKAHNPQPKFQKGTKLLIVEKLCHKMDKGLEVYVNGGRPEEAVYWISEDPNKYGGTVLAYERVEKCCVVA